MAKRVLDVGNCDMDHGSIRNLVQRHFGAEVVRVHGSDDALAALRAGPFNLVVVNRKLDRDGSDGLAIIRQVKADEQLRATPVMLITNYAEYQDQAVAAGAEQGFGKSELGDTRVVENLGRFLS